ncbi:hypothetical protein [uncultured phage cr116_1]|uniref:Uncharacterized protein n=1 Tax=uncultured phage cr116_1 TaxID=2772073 RepID=A0A7M1RY32_9CAUD|nr:hypothetical protein KNV40_gp090 [uncultured phage cr116_1]QOR59353.1 hypothetical protein [uncultured phage cr116_1]DAK53180.1 MAG TPA: hypothetical protein [Crassvirales sp.]
MKLTIDQTVLDKNGLTLEEFLVLFLGAKDVDIESVSQSLIAKGLADKDLFSNGKIVVSDKVKDLISTISIDSDKNVIDKDSEFMKLATELREIYPAGRKDGTTYMWRGTTAEVAKKLKTLVVKYGYTINKEDVIKATKEYVSSFNGNYRYMQLLKYFILKSVKDADGNVDIKSELMSFIENSGQLDKQKEDWVSNMI